METNLAEWLLHANFSPINRASKPPGWSIHMKRSLLRSTEEERSTDKGKIMGTKGPGATPQQATAWQIGTVLMAPPAL